MELLAIIHRHMDQRIQKDIADKISQKMGVVFVEFKNLPQGMGSSVFLAQDEEGMEYVLKTGEGVECDRQALEIIANSGVVIPVPKVCGYFEFENRKTLVMEKIKYSLLEEASAQEMRNLIPSMIGNLMEIHTVKSSLPGAILSPAKSWKEFLLDKYSGEHPWYPWREIAGRDGVDEELVERAVNEIADGIKKTELPEGEYAFLHTDFNQRNLFIDKERRCIAGIIDWSEAIFGDPLYDFARVHMFILHFRLGKETLKEYYDLLALTSDERVREELYLLSMMLDYIAWYSQVKDDFNAGRLRFHQKFLRSNL